jgi:dipeptidyl aminopeptidase/acylaminoacyl peptidase
MTTTINTQQQNYLSLTHYQTSAELGQPQLSPDGSHILYERRGYFHPEHEFVQTELWLMNADGSNKQHIVLGSHGRWSPDGSKFLYLAEGDDETTQIFVYDLQAKVFKQLTHLVQGSELPTWSPDGSKIAFKMFVPSSPRDWPIDLPPPKAGAKRTPEARVIDDLFHKLDGVGYLERGMAHLFVIAADGSGLHQVTPDDFNVTSEGDFCWTPDGERLIVSGLVNTSGEQLENEHYVNVAYLYTLNLADSSLTSITPITPDVNGYWLRPCISPDGQYLLTSGCDWSHKHFDLVCPLWIIKLKDNTRWQVAETLDSSAQNYFWSANSRDIYFSVPIQGHSHLYRTDVEGGLQLLKKYERHSLYLDDVNSDGTAVGVQASFDLPGQLVSFNVHTPDDIHALSTLHDTGLASITLGAFEEVDYLSADGLAIKAWVIYPPDFGPKQRYPLMVVLDKAGDGMWFSLEIQHFAARGYVVLNPHYRSNQNAVGFGTEYINSGFNGFPNKGVFDDIMTGVDTMLARGFIDSKRLFIMGRSQGGEITAYMVGHTNRFAAAVALQPAGINELSWSLTMDASLFYMKAYEKPFWENPQPWLDASPIMHVDKVTTPTLLITGENDLRCPISQSEEFFSALKVIGKAPTKLVRLPEIYHEWQYDMATLMRVDAYTLKWFEDYDPALKNMEKSEG